MAQSKWNRLYDFCCMIPTSNFNGMFDFQVFNNTLYWSWLREVFVPGVYAGAWYNGLQEDQSIYIGDKCSVLVGMPRVRQLRVKPSKYTINRVTLGWLVGWLFHPRCFTDCYNNPIIGCSIG